MLKWLLVFLLVLAAALGALWYWVHRPQEQALATALAESARLQSEAKRCADRVHALEGQVENLETVRAELQRASTELQLKVQEKETELAALRGTQEELLGGLKEEIDRHQVQVQRFRDQLRVDLVDEVLFDSGEADVKPAGRAVLQKVGDILKKAEGRKIEVQGHTDNVPITGALAKRYATNWELSAARAVNVARFLQEAARVPAQRLSATAHSEYQPRAGNDSEEGRHKNRRIEILLGPKAAAEATPPPAS